MSKRFEVLEELGLAERKAKNIKYGEMGRDEEFEMVCDKYPEVPRNIVLKASLCRTGVSFTRKALEVLQDPYYEHNPYRVFQFHGKDHVEDFKIPITFLLNDGSLVINILSPPEKDPYTVDFIDKKFWVMSDGKQIAEINFLQRPQYHDKRTKSGRLMQALCASGAPHFFYFCPSGHCHYWNEGLQCKFCDMDYNTKLQMKMGREYYTRPTLGDYYDIVYEILQEKGRWKQCFMTGGSDPRNNFNNEVDFLLELIAEMKQAAKDAGNSHFPINAIISHYEPEQLQRLKDAGLDGAGLYLEIWDKERFRLICPGKEKYVGYDKCIERTLNAIEIFGRGNISVGWVPGIELAPLPYGFEDVDEAANSVLEGYKFFISRGAVMTGSYWQIGPGSEFYKMGAMPPPLEFYVKIDLGRYLIYKEHGGFKEGKGGIYANQLQDQPLCCYPDYHRIL
ncbi:MAG: radical SAM protein [Thermodesulfobacteriota bacterium]|nr:radical SAM protein [Thermodesulfobacteriota bacterium]